MGQPRRTFFKEVQTVCQSTPVCITSGRERFIKDVLQRCLTSMFRMCLTFKDVLRSKLKCLWGSFDDPRKEFTAVVLRSFSLLPVGVLMLSTRAGPSGPHYRDFPTYCSSFLGFLGSRHCAPNWPQCIPNYDVKLSAHLVRAWSQNASWEPAVSLAEVAPTAVPAQRL